MQMNQIIELNKKKYKEKKVILSLPVWNNKIPSIHSLTSSESKAVIGPQYKIKL